jgi:hypothetical protein
MKKRLAILTVSAITALGAVSGASAALWNHTGPHNNAPVGSCSKADTPCKISSTGQQGLLVPGAQTTRSSSASAGTGYHVK